MHSLIYALTKTGSRLDVDDMMAPYSESREVEPYETDCECVGFKAFLDALQETPETRALEEEKTRCIRARQDLIESFHESPSANRAELDEELEKSYAAQQQIETKLRMIRDGRKQAHPEYGQANADCEDCGGSGRVTSTYNKDGQWDWFEVGGRWKNCLPGNVNKMKASEMLEKLRAGDLELPWAVVSPEGWQTLNDFTWEGSPPLLSPRERRKKLEEVLSRYPDFVVSVVDAHN